MLQRAHCAGINTRLFAPARTIAAAGPLAGKERKRLSWPVW
jgi:hypothetical protein